MSLHLCESTMAESTPTLEDASAPVLDTVMPDQPEAENVDQEIGDQRDSKTEDHSLRNPMDEVDSEEDDGARASPRATVVPVNTPVTGDSGQGSPTMQSSSDSLSDGGVQQLREDSIVDKILAAADGAASNIAAAAAAAAAAETSTEDATAQSSSKADVRSSVNGTKSGKEGVKETKKEEKKKSKKKEDKSVEYILRALNSLQSPEEKLAALCKKYADLHEEHRVLQTSFKTQQRTLTMVVREKDQLQSEHTKAMMAKSKLESLCRELQKHNKMIKDESIKRAKEDDEKRKEISAQFNVTIGEIQNQMSDNSERNNRLRKENENLAEQLRTFISQCQGREEHIKKIQEHHDLEKKLAAAKLAQAEAILKEAEDRNSKERELMLFKLTEVSKKAQMSESQLELYKSKYDEFNDLHTRSSETFQKYKTEMDKMTKRIKKLEKDGLQWKAKWEASSKSLLEQYEARSKSEKETTVYAQKVKKLESLCRALQAELHGKKVVHKEADDEGDVAASNKTDTPSPSAVPPNSPETPSPDQCSPEISQQSSEEAAAATGSSTHQLTPSPSPPTSSDSVSPASSDPAPAGSKPTELATAETATESGQGGEKAPSEEAHPMATDDHSPVVDDGTGKGVASTPDKSLQPTRLSGDGVANHGAQSTL